MCVIAQNPLDTFPRNLVDGEVANLFRTCCGLAAEKLVILIYLRIILLYLHLVDLQ